MELGYTFVMVIEARVRNPELVTQENHLTVPLSVPQCVLSCIQ